MEAVLDARLMGYWSDKDLYLGAMESADVAFRPDGHCWVYWSNVGGFFILRFSWHIGEGRQLTLDMHEESSGTWRWERHPPPGTASPARARVTPRPC